MKATSEALSEVQDQVVARRRLLASGEIRLIREEARPQEDQAQAQPSEPPKNKEGPK